MAKRYIYICKQCEVSISVETSQAGQSVTCSDCDHTQILGTLRDIKALAPESVSEAPVQAKSSATWSPLRRGLFGLGAIALVLGCLAGGYFTWERSKIEINRPAVTLSDEVRQQIENLSPAAMLNEWNQVDASAVQQWVEPKFLAQEAKAREYQLFSTVGWVCAGIGLVLILAALFIKDSAKPSY